MRRKVLESHWLTCVLTAFTGGRRSARSWRGTRIERSTARSRRRNVTNSLSRRRNPCARSSLPAGTRWKHWSVSWESYLRGGPRQTRACRGGTVRCVCVVCLFECACVYMFMWMFSEGVQFLKLIFGHSNYLNLCCFSDRRAEGFAGGFRTRSTRL